MNFNFLVVLVGVLMAAQATQQCSLKDDDTKELMDFVLNKLLLSAKSILSKAADDLQKLEDNKYNNSNIESIVVAEIIGILNVIHTQGVAFMPFIQDLKNEVTNDKKAVVDCIGSIHDKISDIIEMDADNVGSGVVKNTLFITALKDVITQLNELISRVQAQVEKLDACTCTCACS